ncbi:MAG: hypothetical protein DMG96_18225 [Acidobacteria bacterium]|nr:MAG: hypothetical protein DMG96_18225 [Acidobacteriota bacterium]
MPPERIQVVAVLYLMASLSLCSPQLCLAQGNIYSGRVVSQDPNGISLNLKPCGTQRLQTVSPYKTMGNPTQASCPNGDKYTSVMVQELPPHSPAGEFSGEMIAAAKDTITLDLNPCGEKKSVTVFPYKQKGIPVPASCPNGKKYTKVTVEKLPANDKNLAGVLN